MEFGVSSAQALLQESVAQVLARDATLDRVKEFADSEQTRAEDVWSGLCEMGVPGLLVDEQYGGIGLQLLDAALVAETLGGAVSPTPFVASCVMVPLAIAAGGSGVQQERWLPQLAEGTVVAGAAIGEAVNSRLDAQVHADGGKLSGRSLFVLDFEADVYLVADANGALYLVEADAKGLERKPLTTVDKTRPVGELVFNDVAADPLPGATDGELCARIIEAGRVVLSADTLGAAQTMLNKAVEYSKQRVQFNRVIASFQAVKHMCAEMAAKLEPCRSMVWYSAYAFDGLPDESRLTACHTKAHLAEVAYFVSRTATEVHGGIGFTWDLGLHFWFKRIGANRQYLGSPEQCRQEAAELQSLV